MHTYSINEARKIALNCAKQYDKNLNGKNYIIIYRERTSNHIKSIEVKFDTDNYQHLTGIEMIDSYGNFRKNVADLFYSKCIKNTLRKDEIRFKNDGTTNLKLRALPILMNIQKIYMFLHLPCLTISRNSQLTNHRFLLFSAKKNLRTHIRPFAM
ncbi:MAG: hypothetical protein K2M78_01720 [Lachnospiraceae bacterium]|nr:hypothetical protein [Lachnospiraceae bacterium]